MIILSGDVHYGFETVGRMSSPRRGGVSIPFLQLNSSAIKNRLTPEEQSVLAQIARRPRTKQLASRERVFWNLSTDAEADGAIHVSNSLSSSDSEPDLAVSLLPVDKHPEHPYTQFETNLGDLAVDQGMVAHRLLHGDPKQSAQEFLSFTLSSWPVR